MDRHTTSDRHTVLPLVMSLPIGLWLFSLGADVMYRTGRGPASWDDVAFFTMFGGLVVTLLAAVPSFVDEVAGTGWRRHTAEARRLVLILAILALYALNLGVRAYAPGASLPVWLSFAAVTLLALGHARDGGVAPRPYLREVLAASRRHRTARSA